MRLRHGLVLARGKAAICIVIGRAQASPALARKMSLEFPQHRSRAVARGVVYDNDLPVRIILLQDRFQARFENTCGVVRSDEDGDHRIVAA